MLRALAILFAIIAVGCMVLAIVGMVTGKPGARVGGLARLAAVVCFAAAVALNAAAH
jgi:hypothetical protein